MNTILQKRIEEAAKLFDDTFVYTVNAGLHFKKGATFALQNQWISVEEALPKESGFYITCVNCDGVPQCVSVYNYFDAKRKEWIEDDADNCVAVVDYWMQIPSLKGGEE